MNSRREVFQSLQSFREADIGSFILTPLTPAQTHEDFHVVKTNSRWLTGLFDGDWPAGLTLAQNTQDLERHDREFREGVAYSWIVRDQHCGYAGCAYINPIADQERSAKVYTWLAVTKDHTARLGTLNAELKAWFFQHLPADVKLIWKSNDVAFPPD